MEIEFLSDAKGLIEQTIINGESIVRNFLNKSENKKNIKQVTISSISPGLSGASVFKITRMGSDDHHKPALLLKIAPSPDLIEQERRNYDFLVKDSWVDTPILVNSDANMILYEFGGHLANYNPTSLRAGYSLSTADALSSLMQRLVKSLRLFHRIGYDTSPFPRRLEFNAPLAEQIKKFTSIPENRANKLLELWNEMLKASNTYPQYIKCTQGHGDLNSGNVLFEPGKLDSYPVFIDFASIIGFDHEAEQKVPGKLLPFSDFAKIERDLKTRLFLKEALTERLTDAQIIDAIHSIDTGRLPQLLESSQSIKKLATVVSSFRNQIEQHYPKESLDAAYSVAIAFTSISVLYRKVPDNDVDLELQARLAVETAINVLETPVDLQQHFVKTAEVISATKNDSGLKILRTEEIRQIYHDMGRGEFAWIFSTDGFLEVNEPAFFNIILNAVKNDIKMYYFFPRTIQGKVSVGEFSDILRKLLELTDKSILEKVQGYFVSAEGMSLSAQSSRFVVFGKSSGNVKQIGRILLYVRSGGDYWIEMDKGALRENFIAEMQNAIDRVVCRPLNVWQAKWGLPSNIKDKYRTSFQSQTTGQYQSVRELLSIEKAVKTLATEVAIKLERGITKRRPFHEWLDIGCEDGKNTGVAFNVLQSSQLNISLTAIETSPQDYDSIDNVLKYSAFLNEPEWTFEKFVENTQHDYEFDLISSIHSWYVIDPIYLIDAYRMLSNNGIFAMIISPYKNNVLNTMIGVIDKRIAHTKRWTKKAYEEKVITDDPYRNFAEDIESACHKFFGKTGVEIKKRNERIPREQLMTNGKLTDVAKEIVGFFCHTLLVPDDELYSQIETALDIYKDGEWFPCEEWNIILDHKIIASSTELETFEIDSKH